MTTAKTTGRAQQGGDRGDRQQRHRQTDSQTASHLMACVVHSTKQHGGKQDQTARSMGEDYPQPTVCEAQTTTERQSDRETERQRARGRERKTESQREPEGARGRTEEGSERASPPPPPRPWRCSPAFSAVRSSPQVPPTEPSALPQQPKTTSQANPPNRIVDNGRPPPLKSTTQNLRRPLPSQIPQSNPPVKPSTLAPGKHISEL
jgi:hypothetical protein